MKPLFIQKSMKFKTAKGSYQVTGIWSDGLIEFVNRKTGEMLTAYEQQLQEMHAKGQLVRLPL